MSKRKSVFVILLIGMFVCVTLNLKASSLSDAYSYWGNCYSCCDNTFNQNVQGEVVGSENYIREQIIKAHCKIGCIETAENMI